MTDCTSLGIRSAAAAMLMLAAMPASAQQAQVEIPRNEPSKREQTIDKAGKIASQPARDVGAVKTEIPPVLQGAVADPYGLTGIKTCRDLSGGITALNEVIGADIASGNTTKENRAGKVAEAGGKTIVNALIPFRSLVREATGAAPAQRRLDDAIEAGFARRGFLRGVYMTRRCKPAL
jgi:hypothetical protein